MWLCKHHNCCATARLQPGNHAGQHRSPQQLTSKVARSIHVIKASAPAIIAEPIRLWYLSKLGTGKTTRIIAGAMHAVAQEQQAWLVTDLTLALVLKDNVVGPQLFVGTLNLRLDATHCQDRRVVAKGLQLVLLRQTTDLSNVATATRATASPPCPVAQTSVVEDVRTSIQETQLAVASEPFSADAANLVLGQCWQTFPALPLESELLLRRLLRPRRLLCVLEVVLCPRCWRCHSQPGAPPRRGLNDRGLCNV